MENLSSIILICAVVALASYLVGSFNMAIIISKYHKLRDIRNYGSGNAGMTNMLRTFGRKAAAYTFGGDFFKGALAVALARKAVESFELPFDMGYVAALFVVVGHIFPLYFKFKGGKGVATAFGAMLVLNWMVFCTLLVGLVPMLFVIRIVSAVSLCGAALYPVLTFLVLYLQGKDMASTVIPDTLFSLVLAALTFYAHRENIARFRTGTENFFGDKKNEKNGQ
ncbi:MAG: glycerol-3-phosphate 1-O-acyltransferase PlsY [Oscillospiraceae bacterium]